MKLLCRKALRALLTHEKSDLQLTDAIVRHSFVNPAARSSLWFYFEVIDVLVHGSRHHLNFQQSLWLPLVHLGQRDVEIRCKALRALEATHLSSCPPATIARLHVAVRNSAPNIWAQGQLEVSQILATNHPHASPAILGECTLRLPLIR
jgi:hypothetical protein